MLSKYLASTRNLLQSPSAPTQLYSDANLTSWINTARSQVAGEAECIRVLGFLNTVSAQRIYNFTAVTLGVPGVQGVINVRTINYSVGTGGRLLTARPWEWFNLYHLNNPVFQTGFPKVWSQYGQGAGSASNPTATGSFLIDPVPDAVYGLILDCVCYPVDLVDDSTAEAVPFLWTDAVPYFAAYLAYLSAQTGSRQADAARMFELYTEFVQRARRFSNPSVNRYMYQQAADIPAFNKIGLQRASPTNTPNG